MRESELSFMEGFFTSRRNNSNPQQVFDWDKAALEIKNNLSKGIYTVEAGLKGDWDHTSGVIFEDGLPVKEGYMYLSSNWATPVMIITFKDGIEVEYDCSTEREGTRFDSGSEWDDISLSLLGLPLKETDE